MTQRNKSLSLIDVVAGCVVTMCVGGFLWFGLVQNERTRRVTEQLTAQLDAAQRDSAAMLTVLDTQKALLAARAAELARSGQLPATAPVEEYFESLSILTRKLHLRVLRHRPLSPRRYPGLLEQRYTYDVSGSTQDLIHFLQEIEAGTYWADVGFLKIESGTSTRAGGDDPRIASLTISLFSALAVEPEEETTGT